MFDLEFFKIVSYVVEWSKKGHMSFTKLPNRKTEALWVAHGCKHLIYDTLKDDLEIDWQTLINMGNRELRMHIWTTYPKYFEGIETNMKSVKAAFAIA